MKLVQLTDIHLAGPGVLVGGRDPRANLDRALEQVRRLHADAALMVLTGDLCEHPEIQTYRWLAERLDGFPVPVALTLGNHDDRSAFLSVFPDAADGLGYAQSVHPLPIGRAIVLDTLVQGALGGRLGPDRLGWLEARLAEQPDPAWIFMHHNPIPCGLPPLDAIMLEDHDAFATLVGRYRDRIAHIFHGHCHLPMSGALAGVPVSSGRGTNHAGYPHFGAPDLQALSDLPEAYSVIEVRGPATTVMMVEFGYQARAG